MTHATNGLPPSPQLANGDPGQDELDYALTVSGAPSVTVNSAPTVIENNTPSLIENNTPSVCENSAPSVIQNSPSRDKSRAKQKTVIQVENDFVHSHFNSKPVTQSRSSVPAVAAVLPNGTSDSGSTPVICIEPSFLDSETPSDPAHYDHSAASSDAPHNLTPRSDDVTHDDIANGLPPNWPSVRPKTPSTTSSSFQSVTPTGSGTPLTGSGTPVGVAMARPRLSDDAGCPDESETESEEEEEEDGDQVDRVDADVEVNFVQTDRFGFFAGSDQYSGSNHLQKKVSLDVMRKRERKWLDMIDHWEKWMSKRFNKIKERCRKGIPPALRARAWSYLCGSKYMMDHHQGRYDKLLQQEHDPRWVDDITKDLHRQFPCHEMFATQGGWGQKNLFNVLIAYATHNPTDGYCQAMAPLAAVLLMHMPEEQAFWSLVSICDRYMPGYYSAGLEQVQIDGDVLFGLLKKSSNVTYKHLRKQRIDPILIMMEWFMCVFSRTLPWPSVLRVWDMFFCEGIKVLFRISLVLFKAVLGTSAQCVKCPGLYETVEVLKNIPDENLEEEYLVAESLKLNIDEKDMEREHKKQVVKRQKEKEAREKEMEEKREGKKEEKRDGKKEEKKEGKKEKESKKKSSSKKKKGTE